MYGQIAFLKPAQNMNNMNSDIERALNLLHSPCDAPVLQQAAEKLARFLALIGEWGTTFALVSKKDRHDRLEEHVIDSLGLIPVIESLGLTAPRILDVGSGAGFPAIPVAVMLPGLNFTLIERSKRKVGFLLKVKGALSLDNVSIIEGSYPESLGDEAPDVVTARAVDRPGRILQEVTSRLSDGGIFVCQLRIGHREAEGLRSSFEMRTVDDLWQQRGLRRGECHIIRRKP